MSSIDFYFDFSSPYGYFSSTLIDDLAERHNREAHWHPYLMGVVMKLTGRKPLLHIPLVDKYGARDVARSARLHGIEFEFPTQFPVATVAACRAYYWLSEQDKNLAKQLAKNLFHAYFVDNKLISERDVVVGIAVQTGVAKDDVVTALNDPEVKQKLRLATDQAIERKVFGSPFFIVDGEPFWGHDRLYQLERWVRTGGW